MASKHSVYTRPDSRTRAAKAAGYPARSVYKLEEIQRRSRVFRKGQRVLDLGAAPGSWSLYACQQVGPSGRVFGVDLTEITGRIPANMRALQMDVFEAGPTELQQFGPYDVVMSDMAPSTSGSKVSDQARSSELCDRALNLADLLAAPNSHFIAKFFMGPDLAAFKKAVTQRYCQCRIIRPDATRSQSTEIFVLGLDRKPDTLSS